jgi:hypothetical protein
MRGPALQAATDVQIGANRPTATPHRAQSRTRYPLALCPPQRPTRPTQWVLLPLLLPQPPLLLLGHQSGGQGYLAQRHPLARPLPQPMTPAGVVTQWAPVGQVTQ